MADTFGLKLGIEGEKQFKSALADINRSFKVLGSEMKLATSQFDKNDKSVEALTARNTVLNKEIEAQKEKIKTLKSALDNAASSFGENDKRTQNWQVQLNNAEAALNAMEREVKQNNDALDKSENEFKDAEKKADSFGDEVEDAGKQAQSAGGRFQKVASVVKGVGAAMAASMATIGTAAVAAGKKLYDMTNDAADTGDEIDKTSQKLGMSAEAYQEWDYVLGQSGVEITSMTTGLKTLTNQIGQAKNGSEKAQANFEKLGISMSDLNKMSREDVFAAVIKGFQGMSDTTERAALANTLFGKSGQNLTPLFNQTTESTEQLKKAAHDLGFVMSNDAVKASANFKDSLDTLKRTFAGVKNNIMAELMPGFSEIMRGLSELLAGGKGAKEKIQKGVSEIVSSLKDIFPKVVEVIMTLIGAVAEIAPVIIDSLIKGILDCLPTLIQGAIQLILGIVKALPQIIKSLLESLPQIITSIITGLIECLPQLIQGLIQLVIQLITHLPEIILGIIEALPDIISAVIDGLIKCLPQLIEGCIQLVIGLVKALPQIIVSLIKAIPQIITSIVKALVNCLGKIVEVGKNIVKGLWDGISGAAQWLWDQITGWLGGIWDGILGFFGIHSPSTKFRDIVGKNIVRGLAKGITDEAAVAVQAAEDLAKDVADVNFKPGDFDSKGWAKELEDAAPKIDTRAVFDSSNLNEITRGLAVEKSPAPVFNVSVQFGDVSIDSDMDIRDVASRVSSLIVNDIMVKGRAYN